MRRRSAVLLLCLLAFAGCDSLLGNSNIQYDVTGSGVTKVSLTYENSDGGTSQISSATLPWSYSFKAKKDDFLYVSAQITEGTGTITVTIRKNDKTYKTSNASGFAAIATASGSN
jgi:hypothetical protein